MSSLFSSSSRHRLSRGIQCESVENLRILADIGADCNQGQEVIFSLRTEQSLQHKFDVKDAPPAAKAPALTRYSRNFGGTFIAVKLVRNTRKVSNKTSHNASIRLWPIKIFPMMPSPVFRLSKLYRASVSEPNRGEEKSSREVPQMPRHRRAHTTHVKTVRRAGEESGGHAGRTQNGRMNGRRGDG